jgi:protein-S-isoprenylcysteine O-methyltransferase Ste14
VSLVVRNVVFTVVVPGVGAIVLPWWILTSRGSPPALAVPVASMVIAVGAALYITCLWLFARIGRGTPGPWDAPRRLVTAGPYRWVRNPIYLGALLVVVGEAWLFLAPALLAYAMVMALAVHLFVVGYEEPTLRRTFGDAYREYLATVPRWIPRRPRGGSGRPGA